MLILHPANYLYWFLLGMGIIFFLSIILSGAGEEEFEIETDTDFHLGGQGFDVDADLEADLETETEIENGPGFNPLRLLSWIGLGKAPLMMLLGINFSIWGMTGWILNTIFYSLTGRIPESLLGLGGLIFVLSFLAGIFSGSLLSRPIGKIFASFGEDVKSERLIGCIGTVTSKKLPHLTEGKIGQVDVYDTAGNLMTISATLPEWANVIPHRGDEVLIIDQQKHGYLVIAKESSDEDKWGQIN